ncbi:uncharacterized protein Tco025E_04441 [Trypanosoma conorhini]|uniref:C2 domain-containing protein n=1 Tax=Trypanosoma conorhini TaxID=83891 RepID=A0A3R7N9E0_9TRYP|nr:uncharacterized protein Tco025E_04441 [Trypanosoma conorhini]RNF18544.1 hypothetical protein Tco025E_04441 [Trypanosoma conorhini]
MPPTRSERRLDEASTAVVVLLFLIVVISASCVFFLFVLSRISVLPAGAKVEVPAGMIKIRILHLSVLSEDAGDFRHGGLYVVVRVGDEAQRTAALAEGDRAAWNEVFHFHLPSPPAAGVAAGSARALLEAPLLAGGPPPLEMPPYPPSLPRRRLHASGVGGSDMAAVAPAAPWAGSPFDVPTVALELWRHSATSDDCLAKYHFPVAHEVGEGVVDSCVRLRSASSYSVEFALRVRVALVHAGPAHALQRPAPQRAVLREPAVLWGP